MRTPDDRPEDADFSDQAPGASGTRTRAVPGGAAPGTQPATIAEPGGPAGHDYYDDGYTEADPPALLREQDEDFYAELPDRPAPWTAGADLGLLVLRLGLGGVFALHGAQKLFGAFGGPGRAGFADALRSMGFAEPEVLSLVTGATELAAGALLVLGLFTPLAAAGVLGVMASAVIANRGSGFFAPEGVEFPAVLAVAALALLFSGPGRVAADKGRAWFRRPMLFGVLGLLVAAGATAAVFVLLYQGL
ncbi:DoxX family protein [Bounagaea algeriensis]